MRSSSAERRSSSSRPISPRAQGSYEFDKRRTAPERKGVPQAPSCRRRPCTSRLAHELLEATQIDITLAPREARSLPAG